MIHCQSVLTVFHHHPFRPRMLLALAMLACGAVSTPAIDCNLNGQEDGEDLVFGFSQDCNGNTIPDECEIQVQERLLSEVPFLSTVMPADLDGDGDLDVIATSLIGLFWEENIHPDSLMVSHNLANSNSPARSLRAADMNRDGHLDIVADLGSTLRIFHNNGASPPSFSPQNIPTELLHLDVIVTGDLNGDNQPDVLVGDSNDDTLFLYLQENGSYTGYPVPDAGYGVVACVSGDLDSDGHQDLVLANYTDDTVLALMNNGTVVPAFTTVALSQSIGGPLDLKLADMDQDGDLDVVVAAFEDQEIVVLHNLGGSLPLVQRETLHTGAEGLWSLDVSDMDGDGDQDVLSAHKLTSNVWMHTSSGGSEPEFLSQVIAEGILFVEEVYHGDTNHDGLPDIVVPSRTDHEILGYSGFVIDCNNNGVADWCDIDEGTSSDCNGNGRPDECETDCNGNGLPDICDVLSGYSRDMNSNGHPDECEKPAAPQVAVTRLPGPQLWVTWAPVDIATGYRVELISPHGDMHVFATTTAAGVLIGAPYTDVGLKFSLRVIASSARP
jgi:hypothetical protein